MSWVRVDDKIAFHRKVVASGNEAFGAWMRMTAWCADHLTDGHVPAAIAWVVVGHGREEVLTALIKNGLLDRNGDDFVVHDYNHHNPFAADVKAKRNADAERKTKGRTGQGRDDSGRIVVRAESMRTDDGIRKTSTGPVPVPVPEEQKTLVPLAARPSFDFGAIYARYPRRKNMATGKKKLEAIVKTQADYDAVVQGLDRFLAEERRKGTAADYYPHFATWVNQRRWEDEDDPVTAGPPIHQYEDLEDIMNRTTGSP